MQFYPGQGGEDHHLAPQKSPDGAEAGAALLTFYRSRAYRLLEREETKLWHESPAQIYAEFLKPRPRTSRSYQNGPHHSKLAPYSEQITEWRARGMTLREIAEELGKYGCRTTAQNLSLFLRNRHKN